MEIKAELNYFRIAPRKVRLVASLIKGMNVSRAEVELRHWTKRSAGPLSKLLKSAVANAKHNFQLAESELAIKDIKVDEGPTLKRSMPRAFGRAAPIRKRSSHVTIILGTIEPRVLPINPEKREIPVIRDVTPEDVAAIPVTARAAKTHDREDRKFKGRGGKRLSKSIELVRRVFRRKAI